MTNAMPPGPVTTHDRDGIRVLEMSGPRLNTIATPLRTALIEALDAAEHDATVYAVVLIGGEGTFSAGADLTEFDAGTGLSEPSLHYTINGFLDRMSTPVVAAIAGAALGGGFELALAAHYRVAASDAVVGLPETRFGFIPGAGGTQRLPRLIGIERGYSAISRAEHLRREDIENTSLIDRWAPDAATLLEVAIQFAREIAGATPPRVRDLVLGDDDAEQFLVTAEHAARRRSDRPHIDLAVLRALDAGRTSFDVGVAEEFRLFRELANSPEAAAARHIFLAERRALRVPGIDAVDSPQRVGIVGAGMMGRGIALALLRGGIRVDLTDLDEQVRAAATSWLAIEAEDLIDALRVVPSIAEFDNPELVIEAVIENHDVKGRVFSEVAATHPSAVIASNTSGLDLDSLADGLPDPTALIGLHFFAPAQTMRVVEVVRTRASSPAALAAGLALVRRLGKVPVLSAVGPGFIGNRMFDRYLAAALHLVLVGAEPRAIDSEMLAWGMRMGPFATLDLIGNDVVWHARTPAERKDPAWALVGELVDRGDLGRKSGRGWYDYAAAPPPRPHRGPRPTADPAVVESILYPMVDEGVRVLADGIAQRPGDIDVLFLRGYGFPSESGGPMWFGDAAGLANIVRVLSRPGSPQAPHPTLVEMATSRCRIADWEARA